MKGDEDMCEYRKLNFSKLNFSDEIVSYEDALKNVTPLQISKEVILGKRKIQVTNAEKDCDNKCVKLEIYC